MSHDEEHLGEALDVDHVPETNGRMPICRRCGRRTTGVHDERHAEVTDGAARVRGWLNAQAMARQAARFRSARDT